MTYRCGCPYDDADPTCATHGEPREPRVFGEWWIDIEPDGSICRDYYGRPILKRQRNDVNPFDIKVRIVEIVELVEP